MNASCAEGNVLLRTKNLYKVFPQPRTIFAQIGRVPPKLLKAVDHVSLDIYQGENLGLVGESGCGKSTLARTMIRLYDCDGGNVYFEGKDIMALSAKELRKERKNFQMIFQDPCSSLNPRMSVMEILKEVYLYHGICSKAEAENRCLELMEMTGLNRNFANRFPGEFSGGQRQRLGIARALALRPKLVIADEPVSALDVSIQAQILNLLLELQKKTGITLLFISHDLRVVRYVSQRVAVMYLGRVVELAPTEEVYKHSLHPYTGILLKANPGLDPRSRNPQAIIKGDPPSPIDLPNGCRFHPRCPYGMPACREKEPQLEEASPGHYVACHCLKR